MNSKNSKRKMKKILITIFSVFIVLLLVPILYFMICNWIYPGKTDDEKIAYIKQHQWRLDDDCAIKDTSLFEEVRTPAVFILGEIHGFSRNQIFDAELLKYLNKKFGVTDYFNENFTEDANLLNRFLETSPMNVEILKQTMASLKDNIPQRYNQEYIDKWVSIYQYNQALPKGKKIKVYGLLGNKADFKGMRDSTMIANYKSMRTEFSDSASIFCSTGQGHVFQANYSGIQPFGAWLKANGSHVVSIAHLALKSYAYIPKGAGMPTPDNELSEWLSIDGPIMYFQNIVNFNKAFDSPTIALCKLDAKNSPFSQGLDIVKQHSTISFLTGGNISPDESCSTTDYFQYVFVTKGLKGPKLMK